MLTPQSAPEQRRLLNVVIEEASWKDRALRTTLLEPFEIMRYSHRESRRKENENAGSGRDSGIWLLRYDSNLQLVGRSNMAPWSDVRDQLNRILDYVFHVRLPAIVVGCENFGAR
jgi:hypothetical protein